MKLNNDVILSLREALEDIQDAHDNHIYNDGEHPESNLDCRYCCTMHRIKITLARLEQSQ